MYCLPVRINFEIWGSPYERNHVEMHRCVIFAEPTDGLEVINEIGESAKGTTETLTLNLDPGNYRLVCNLPCHYGTGAYMGFTVVS